MWHHTLVLHCDYLPSALYRATTPTTSPHTLSANHSRHRPAARPPAAFPTFTYHLRDWCVRIAKWCLASASEKLRRGSIARDALYSSQVQHAIV
ncbi:hypothetical protein E2C01_003021 [Portunus trituberculatus]|uniref:Uncharacterized protein n=1 Tax=Portunus trituberculatus TaxID=210409 RepID=A0A5B7CL96_PORTR|nr:hypothetical protein [Portunus trituberculatus]